MNAVTRMMRRADALQRGPENRRHLCEQVARREMERDALRELAVALWGDLCELEPQLGAAWLRKSDELREAVRHGKTHER